MDGPPAAVPAPPARFRGPGAGLDARIDALSAAEAELSFRERRAGEREMSFNVAVQRVVDKLAEELLEGGVPSFPRS